LETRWVEEAIAYDGSQLRAHWILRRIGIEGEALVAFRGACAVARDEVADLADIDGPGIAGDDMVHFLWERFDDSGLDGAMLRQRLLTCIAAEALDELGAPPVRRDGDDLWIDDRKLSISIATRSLVSTLIHFAINVTTRGTPVPTSALADFGIEPAALAREVLERVLREERSIARARAKVRGKGEAR